ncbi:hypothetical protein DP73_09280 [Desulfosporosinus sp. HMP52]|nr:hypothetical protein DP73_09280 [Desulfosporosinus sp. HMP52]
MTKFWYVKNVVVNLNLQPQSRNSTQKKGSLMSQVAARNAALPENKIEITAAGDILVNLVKCSQQFVLPAEKKPQSLFSPLAIDLFIAETATNQDHETIGKQ